MYALNCSIEDLRAFLRTVTFYAHLRDNKNEYKIFNTHMIHGTVSCSWWSDAEDVQFAHIPDSPFVTRKSSCISAHVPCVA